MDTSSFAKRTAVLPSIRPSISALLAVCTMTAAPSHAEDLFDSIRSTSAEQPGGYVFVSERVSETALIPLARDAAAAGFTIVLNGFWGDLNVTRQRIARINAACCEKNGAHWQINPLLFERYDIRSVPSVVLSVGPARASTDYSKVTGEMSVANALKFFGQQSRIPAVRRTATQVYNRAFATQ